MLIITRSQLDDGPPCWFFRTERPVAHGWALSRLVSGGHAPMQSRRKLLLKFAVCFIATSFVVASVVADELLGVLSKVDTEGKKITVVEKDTDKEIEVKVNDDTEYPTKNNTKYDLEKLEGLVKKQTDARKKVNVKVTHDKKVASKIEFQKKKGAGKKKDN
jgi:hypothetical protein